MLWFRIFKMVSCCTGTFAPHIKDCLLNKQEWWISFQLQKEHPIFTAALHWSTSSLDLHHCPFPAIIAYPHPVLCLPKLPSPSSQNSCLRGLPYIALPPSSPHFFPLTLASSSPLWRHCCSFMFSMPHFGC